MPGKQLLICGRLFEAGRGGGLEVALQDLAEGLRRAGWTVDLALTPDSLGLEPSGRREQIEGLSRSRWSWLPRFRFLPADLRTILQHMLLDGGFADGQSDLIRAIDRRLARHRYDAVLACVPREAPGIARFIAGAHRNAILLSLDGLGGELRRAPFLALPRTVARILRKDLHPAMYRAVEPRQVRLAVFASAAWEAEAIRAGLPPSVCRTIHFGVPDPRPLPPLPPSRGRLLWVGRLSREKGLHLFLEAVATLRRSRPVTLTAICGPGPVAYRRQIEDQIHALGLSDCVRLEAAVDRSALPAIYRQHDVLLFWSVFAEPVALVATEAFAAGLPVAGPRPPGPSALIRPGLTAQCFATAAPAAIASAVDELLTDHPLRMRLRAAAHQLVSDHFSIDAMVHAYTTALDPLLEARA